MKKIVYTILVVLMFNSTVNGFSLTSCDSTTEGFSNSNVANMDTIIDESDKLLKASSNLFVVSTQMLNASSTVDSSYIEAMIRLSKDMQIMANHIGEMADRIVATELQIGVMGDRIVLTQKIESENLALTQANLLKAQENFNQLLLVL